MISLSTHVLDTERGRPAVGVRVELYRGGKIIARGSTNDDGRITDLARDLAAGNYRLVFHPPSPFFRLVALEVAFDEDGHYHVPLLVSSYGCASYRGS